MKHTFTVVRTSIAILSWVVLNQPTRDVDLMVVVFLFSLLCLYFDFVTLDYRLRIQ